MRGWLLKGFWQFLCSVEVGFSSKGLHFFLNLSNKMENLKKGDEYDWLLNG